MYEFPKVIQVTRESPDTEDAFLLVTEGEPEEALTSTDNTQVATYELKIVREGKLEPVFSAEIK